MNNWTSRFTQLGMKDMFLRRDELVMNKYMKKKAFNANKGLNRPRFQVQLSKNDFKTFILDYKRSRFIKTIAI